LFGLSVCFRVYGYVRLKGSYCLAPVWLGVSLRINEALAKARRALASRYLFDNWLSLLIRYALIRLGFNVKLVARVGDCTFELSPEAFGRIYQ